ncbi:MAG: N-acetylmuramoyl-L-alanine amidase [Bdellovibrionaceae bacterium]|nr:N-acetylmuramoyl-L-alanine amidase [Pseudobdellovibrionaceae bacterium]
MLRISPSARFMCVLFALHFFVVNFAHAGLHVVIDPGHGGVDTGATRGSIRESHIALSVAKKLAEHLRADNRFTVTLTRESDIALTLPERAAVAKRVKADLFISIHANASEDPRAQGVEFWFQNQLPANEESLFLVSRENQSHESSNRGQSHGGDETPSPQRDVSRIIEDLHRNHRIAASSDFSQTLLSAWYAEGRRKNKNAIRQAPFFVVSEVHVPSVLVELGFLSHENEGPRLSDVSHQALMARHLSEGVSQFASRLGSERIQ